MRNSHLRVYQERCPALLRMQKESEVLTQYPVFESAIDHRKKSALARLLQCRVAHQNAGEPAALERLEPLTVGELRRHRVPMQMIRTPEPHRGTESSFPWGMNPAPGRDSIHFGVRLEALQ